MESWEHRGLETWMDNQERAKKRVAVRKNVIRKQQQTRAARSESARLCSVGMADALRAVGCRGRWCSERVQAAEQARLNFVAASGFAVTFDRRKICSNKDMRADP